MIEVDMSEAQYRSIARTHSTLVIRRKSVWIYKGRLCIRCDAAPSAQIASVSIPTANRCGIKLIFLLHLKRSGMSMLSMYRMLFANLGI